MTKTTDEALTKQLSEEAKVGLESFLVMETVGEKEKVDVTNEELDAELAKMGEQYKMSAEQVKQALGQQIVNFRHNMLMQKIEQFLFENNK